MSADNWALCPKCKQKADQDYEKKMADLQAQYGKIPAAEYVSALRNAEARPVQRETLREDYEMGTDEYGTFSVSYRASCNCGFSFKFKHEEKALKP